MDNYGVNQVAFGMSASEFRCDCNKQFANLRSFSNHQVVCDTFSSKRAAPADLEQAPRAKRGELPEGLRRAPSPALSSPGDATGVADGGYDDHHHAAEQDHDDPAAAADGAASRMAPPVPEYVSVPLVCFL